jgi:hypothetical protein
MSKAIAKTVICFCTLVIPLMTACRYNILIPSNANGDKGSCTETVAVFNVSGHRHSSVLSPFPSPGSALPSFSSSFFKCNVRE